MIAWDYSQNILHIIKNSIEHNHEWKELLFDVVCFYDREIDFLKILLLQTVGYESFLRNMRETNISILKYYVNYSATSSRASCFIDSGYYHISYYYKQLSPHLHKLME